VCELQIETQDQTRYTKKYKNYLIAQKLNGTRNTCLFLTFHYERPENTRIDLKKLNMDEFKRLI